MTLLLSSGNQLLALSQMSTKELVLVAPFVTLGAARRVLAACPAGVQLVVVTRWRLEDIAAGVSDPRIFELVKARAGRVLIHDQLHAKLYRSDDRYLIGSANLTATALGWSPRPNVELLYAPQGDVAPLVAFENALTEESSLATAEMAQEALTQAKLLPSVPRCLDVCLPAEVAAGVPENWLPSVEAEALRLSPRPEAIREELHRLGIDPTLCFSELQNLLAEVLLLLPIVQALNKHLLVTRRFGETRHWLKDEYGLSYERATLAWQCLRSWLVTLLPDRYEDTVPGRHSQCLRYLTVQP